jgi:aarF domain-containing kinase
MFFMLNGEEELLATHGVSAFAVDTLKDGQSEASQPAYVIPSSNEERLTVTYLLQTYILEPISTFFRFLHLALLFGPVILTSPMLLVGTSNSSRSRTPGQGGSPEDVERWGAVWWHGFLVSQMERAGPTFIKVSQLDRCRRHTI